MEIGVVFPQTCFGGDAAVIREFAVTAERLGYAHLLSYDHVLGASHEGRDVNGTYDEFDPFHEPLVLFGFLAGITSRIELATAVLILPQRQTALVAKQAAEIAILSGDRFRLGVGVGWNHIEYEALKEEFATRGARSEEQVEVLRRLWTEPLVDFRGRWHTIDRASIFPRPARPIPIWFGGFAEVAVKRAARLGDGFMFPGFTDTVRGQIGRLHGYLERQGREPASFGMQTLIPYGSGSATEWQAAFEGCREVGMTHVAVNTIDAGFRTPQEHIDALRVFADFAGLAPMVGA